MKQILAWLCGVYEFRRSFTTHFRDWRSALWYDRGREFAHIITFRRFDQ